MNLAGLLGDDEHTAADGPYSRVMKTRKWLYISAITAQIFSLNLYKVADAEKIITFVKLPAWWLATGVLFGLAYLMIQYGFLLGQLLSTYDIVLRERLVSRRADEVRQRREAYEEASQRQFAHIRDWRETEKVRLRTELATAQATVKALSEDQSRTAAIDTSQWAEHLREMFADSQKENEAILKQSMQDALERLEIAAAEVAAAGDLRTREPSDPAYGALQIATQKAWSAYDEINKQEPSERWGYRNLERFIDGFRVVPPGVLSVWALWQLSHWLLNA